MRPKAFLSSTSYDLADLRAELVELLDALGFEPVYFESPDFPVPGGLHSHDVCLDAVASCDTYILVINRRYGGEYAGTRYPAMRGLGITHAESRLAFELDKRVFVFVRQALWDERATVRANAAKGVFVAPVHADSPRIFDLIDEILHRQADNWIHFVDSFRDSVRLKQLVTAALRADVHRSRSPGETGTPREAIAGFLQTLGLSHSIGNPRDRYYNLPLLYVPPREYPQIKELLETRHFVLILGDPQIGKTYTALHLLYHYYQEGHRPIWESIRDTEVRDPLFARLQGPRFDIEHYVQTRLAGRNVVYLEDPWGKIEFDLPEQFTASLDALAQRAGDSKSKLIITSRSSIFRRIQELVGTEFVVSLRATLRYAGDTPSYDDHQRKHLLDNYNAVLRNGRPLDKGVAEQVVRKLVAPDGIRQFCQMTSDTDSTTALQQAIDGSSGVEDQFAMELVGEARPHPVGRPHRVALSLLVYASEQSRNFIQANRDGDEVSFRSLFESLVIPWRGTPFSPYEEALEAFGDRVVRRAPTDEAGRGLRGEVLQFSHPVYLEGVRLALRDSGVRRLMRDLVAVLGDTTRCAQCGYYGPMLHAYQYKCNESEPEGPTCPKCFTWGRVGWVLVGYSLPCVLEGLYLDLDLIRSIVIHVGSEKINITVVTQRFLMMSVLDFKKLLCDVVKSICNVSLKPNDYALRAGGVAVDDALALQAASASELELLFLPRARKDIKWLAEAIHKATTDIDW